MRSRISKRSLAFTLLGAFFILQGIHIIGAPPTDPDLAIAHELWIPLDLRIALWTGTGLATVLFAWAGRLQWLAPAAAIIMPAERTLSYLWSFIHWALPGPPGGSAMSLVDAGRWAVMAGLVIVIAGWVEWDRAGGSTNGD